MKFNYFKELISSALLCALCVNGCGIKKNIASKCITNANGEITELELTNNAVVEAEFFTKLDKIEKLTISGEQRYLQQSHFDAIATSKTLKEVHLTYNSASIVKVDMTVLKNTKNLSVLEVSDSCAKRINFAKMTNVKELKVSKANLDQKMVDDMAKLPEVTKVSFDECNFHEASITSFNSSKKLQEFKLIEVSNIQGQTLTNKNIKNAEYRISSKGRNNFCMNSNSRGIRDGNRKSLKPCSGAFAAGFGPSHNDNAHGASLDGFGAAMKKNKGPASCGPRKGNCPPGQCCSKDGKCGIGMKYCGFNCLPKYGKCNRK